jgi:receptor protein-tyrosine kinase
MAAVNEGKPLVIQPSEFKNLSVLTSGPIPPAPTEVMAARIDQTIRRLRELGSMVVIDTPPVLPVSDARLVAPEVDSVLMIAASGHTKSGTLRSALDHLAMAQSSVVGVVLNQVRESGARYAGYGSYYNRAHEPVELVGRD